MNIWTGLLFLDGSLTDVGLARELAADASVSTAAAPANERVSCDRQSPSARDTTPSRRAPPDMPLR
jgi:hypothetical protein